jgi:hypothetical protein
MTMSDEADNLRAVYQAAWSEKVDEIRRRSNGDPFVPYEAHDAGVAAVVAYAMKQIRYAWEEYDDWRKEPYLYPEGTQQQRAEDLYVACRDALGFGPPARRNDE